jgi:hypothetical protein
MPMPTDKASKEDVAPENSASDIVSNKVQEKRRVITMCLQREMKRAKIAEKKRRRKKNQKAKEERKARDEEQERKRQFNKESMNYDGEYMEDYGTHFFCNHLPSYYFVNGPCYQKPAQKVASENDPDEEDAEEDDSVEIGVQKEGAMKEDVEVVEAINVEEQSPPAPDSRIRPQVRKAAQAKCTQM